MRGAIFVSGPQLYYLPNIKAQYGILDLDFMLHLCWPTPLRRKLSSTWEKSEATTLVCVCNSDCRCFSAFCGEISSQNVFGNPLFHGHRYWTQQLLRYFYIKELNLSSFRFVKKIKQCIVTSQVLKPQFHLTLSPLQLSYWWEGSHHDVFNVFNSIKIWSAFAPPAASQHLHQLSDPCPYWA